MQGQELCKVLRGVRRAIAEANEIPFSERGCDCTDCNKGCTVLQEEKTQLETMLLEKRKNGKAVRYAGQLKGLKGTWKTRTVIPYPEEYTRKSVKETEQQEAERYEKELKALQEYHPPVIPEDVVMSIYQHSGLFSWSEYAVIEREKRYFCTIRPSVFALKYRREIKGLLITFPVPESAAAEIAEAFAPAEAWEEFYPLEEIVFDSGCSRVYCRYRYHVLSTDERFCVPLSENHSAVMANIESTFRNVCQRYYEGDEWDVLRKEFRF